ncbi:DUF2007 domain-containing protein [Chryseobacterium sp.]|uniref:putative signal transducing protein n=1 Tax=Chryseobacterium sp. TaxID=1871047 RepID=UPI0025B89F9D|nr:DUF2007 domain-containing protein [Chryseobacterium sp.]
MSDLIRIKYYENAIEANRDKQILEESGIQSFIANEQLIQSDWLLSQAVGGIQLQVFEEEVEKAKQILEDYKENEEYSLEVEHTIPNPEFDFTCPRCGSNHIYQDEKPGGVFGVSWLFLGFPVKIPGNLYHCYYCGNEFKH